MHWLPEARESALVPLTSILTTALLSGFWDFAGSWRKCYGASTYPSNDAIFSSSGEFSRAVAKAPIIIMLFRNIAKSI